MIKINETIQTETSYERTFVAESEFSTSTGATFIICHKYHKIHEDGDPVADKASYNNETNSTSIDVILPNGKKLTDGHFQKIEKYMTDNPSPTLKNCIKGGCEYVIGFCGFGYIGASKETAPKILELIAEVEKEATENVAEIREKIDAEHDAEIAHAEKIVKKAESIINDGGKLRTNAERKAWEKQYNNCMNEGGEGYVPHYPSIEEYENAKKKTFE